MQKNVIRAFSTFLAAVMLVVAVAPAYASESGVDTAYSLVSPIYAAYLRYMRWKESNPNADESEYTGYRPSGTFGSERHGGGFSQADFDDEYNTFVAELPAPIFTSAGTCSWKILPDRLYLIDDGISDSKLSVLSDRISFSGSVTSMSKSYIRVFFSLREPFYAPISGTYSLSLHTISSHNVDSFYSSQFTGVKEFLAGDICLSEYQGTSSRSNSVIGFCIDDSIAHYKALDYKSFVVLYEGYVLVTCVPLSSSNNTTYNITTRPTSITGGNYGIIGDDGQITTVTDNSSIVNETTNNFYNPATGETLPIQDWSYDYSTRTYTLTVDTGDTTTNESGDIISITKPVTVTYGDENITIQEGSTTGDTITNNYTIYYMVEGTGSGNTHTHDWRESSVIDASCIQSGRTVYTCADCGDTKQTTIPALGHSWHVLRAVTNQYDEDGTQIQEGYILYECERCGEQYRTTDTSIKPSPGDSGNTGGVSGSDGSGNSSGVFSGIFGLLVDFLSFFWNTFRDFVGSGVKAFLSALMDGTSDIFGLLNPFDWSA